MIHTFCTLYLVASNEVFVMVEEEFEETPLIDGDCESDPTSEDSSDTASCELSRTQRIKQWFKSNFVHKTQPHRYKLVAERTEKEPNNEHIKYFEHVIIMMLRRIKMRKSEQRIKEVFVEFGNEDG
eukprot:550258_1